MKTNLYTYVLTIDGMKCGACEAHVNNIIYKNFIEVKKVKSSARKNLTTIISKSPLDMELVKKKIDETGYIVKDINQK